MMNRFAESGQSPAPRRIRALLMGVAVAQIGIIALLGIGGVDALFSLTEPVVKAWIFLNQLGGMVTVPLMLCGTIFIGSAALLAGDRLDLVQLSDRWRTRATAGIVHVPVIAWMLGLAETLRSIAIGLHELVIVESQIDPQQTIEKVLGICASAFGSSVWGISTLLAGMCLALYFNGRFGGD